MVPVRFPDVGRTASEVEFLLRWARYEVAFNTPDKLEVAALARERAQALGDLALITQAGTLPKWARATRRFNRAHSRRRS